MKYLIIALALLSTSFVGAAEKAQTLTYRGPWKTTNRKLDGIMTAVVTSTGKERWKGRFYGTWMGVDFDYTVNFTGPPDNLRGTARIDGADYQWTGKMETTSPGSFTATFTGSRYTGSFDMKEVVKK